MYWIRSDIEIFRSRRALTVVAGMKKTYDHAEPTKVERKKSRLYFGICMRHSYFNRFKTHIK